MMDNPQTLTTFDHTRNRTKTKTIQIIPLYFEYIASTALSPDPTILMLHHFIVVVAVINIV